VARNGINHYEERAIALRRSGYFVVFVDYLCRRHLTDCAGGRDISHAQVAADVLEAAQWIMGETRIASGKVITIGWSYGGGGVLAALKAMPAEPPLIGKVVLYYPDCRQATPWRSAGVSVLILMGGMDEVTPPTACERVLKGARPMASAQSPIQTRGMASTCVGCQSAAKSGGLALTEALPMPLGPSRATS